MKAMVLAAGLGTRLRPITYDMPKPLVPVLDVPVMEHSLRLLKTHGITDVVSNLHYFPDQMRKYFGNGSRCGVSLDMRYEEELLGTAGGVRNVADHFGDEPFLVISGDALTDIDLTTFIEFHKKTRGIATLALKRVADTEEYGVVILDTKSRITGFQEKPKAADSMSDLANCGIYIFEPEIFEYFPDQPLVDWAQDVFPVLLEKDVAFYGHEIDRYWNDVGSFSEYFQGNFDALRGEVKVEIDAEQIEPGIYLGEGSKINNAEIDGPLFIGRECTIGDGAQIIGPAVIGSGVKIGSGAAVRECVIWRGCELLPNSLTVGAVIGERGTLFS